MNKLTLRYNTASKVIELYFKEKEVQHFLSSLPAPTRTWNKGERCWAIVPEVLHKVISYSRHSFNHIDSSSLPISYQKIVQEALQGIPESKSTKISTPEKGSSPYSTLYLTADAPDFVVKAVYRALAFEHHPDRGGKREEFQRVKEAYETITGEASGAVP